MLMQVLYLVLLCFKLLFIRFSVLFVQSRSKYTCLRRPLFNITFLFCAPLQRLLLQTQVLFLCSDHIIGVGVLQILQLSLLIPISVTSRDTVFLRDLCSLSLTALHIGQTWLELSFLDELVILPLQGTQANFWNSSFLIQALIIPVEAHPLHRRAVSHPSWLLGVEAESRLAVENGRWCLVGVVVRAQHLDGAVCVRERVLVAPRVAVVMLQRGVCSEILLRGHLLRVKRH